MVKSTNSPSNDTVKTAIIKDIVFICDLVCEKGSYDLSKWSTLTNHNSPGFLPITIILHPTIYSAMLGVQGDQTSG